MRSIMAKNIYVLLLGVFFMIFNGCSTPIAIKDPKNMTTAEIIFLLENEDIDYVATSHSQHISIFLKNGKKFSGRYNASEAPEKYQKENLNDILNLTVYIKNHRIRKWKTLCE